MRRIKDSKTRAAAGADKEEGRRLTIVSAPAAASPELSDRPRRRHLHGARQIAHPWGGRPRRGRPWRGRRDHAPRGALLVGPVGLAASARRRRLRRAEPRQARPQNRRTKSAGGGTRAFTAGQSSPETAVGAYPSDKDRLVFGSRSGQHVALNYALRSFGRCELRFCAMASGGAIGLWTKGRGLLRRRWRLARRCLRLRASMGSLQVRSLRGGARRERRSLASPRLWGWFQSMSPHRIQLPRSRTRRRKSYRVRPDPWRRRLA